MPTRLENSHRDFKEAGLENRYFLVILPILLEKGLVAPIIRTHYIVILEVKP